MSESNYRPKGDGVVEGDTKPMPDRGVMTGVSDTYGADIGQEATNSMGGITGDTQSDGFREGGLGKNKRGM